MVNKFKELKNKIELLHKIYLIYKEVRQIMNERQGIKTTEFWVLIINIVSLIITTFIGQIKPETMTVITGILSGLYIIARTIVKVTKSKYDDELVGLIYDKILSKMDIKE
ncbi:MAG: hypothetical protein QXJ14_03455 [Candidatus Aenigmatarchaeota archaeon]